MASRTNWLIPAFVLGTAIVVFIEFMVVGLVPTFVDELHISMGKAAALVSVFALAAGVLGPVVTVWFNRGRPRIVLPIILGVYGLSCLFVASLPAYWLLFAVRLAQGALLTPFLGIASATAGALAKPGRAGQAIGRVTLGTVVGGVLAVPASLALANAFGWRTVFFGFGLLAFAAAACIGRAVPAAVRLPAPAKRTTETLRTFRFAAHLVLTVLVFTAMFATYTYVAPLFEDVLHMPPNAAAVALFAFGAAGIVGNWSASHVVDRNPLIATIVVIVVLALVTAALPFATGRWVLIAVVIALWGMAHNGAFVANLVRVIFAAGDAPALGAALNISAANVGIGLGALWGGAVVNYGGLKSVGFATVIAALLAFFVALLLIRTERQAFGSSSSKRSTDAG